MFERALHTFGIRHIVNPLPFFLLSMPCKFMNISTFRFLIIVNINLSNLVWMSAYATVVVAVSSVAVTYNRSYS